jgi:hypothetical protein
MIYGMWVLLSAIAVLESAVVTSEWDPLPMLSPRIPQDTEVSPLRDQIKCICSKGRMGMRGESLDLVLAQSASRFIRISSMAAAAMVVSDRLSRGCIWNRLYSFKASSDALFWPCFVRAPFPNVFFVLPQGSRK